MQDRTKFQIKQSGGHFELWCRDGGPQWFFMARRNSIRELIVLLVSNKGA